MKRDTLLQYALPAGALLAAVCGWEAVVRINDIQPVILPSPSRIVETLIKDWRTLLGSLEVTLSITFEALVAATVGGFLLALVFAATVLGFSFFFVVMFLEWYFLHRWHESARTPETE